MCDWRASLFCYKTISYLFFYIVNGTQAVLFLYCCTLKQMNTNDQDIPSCQVPRDLEYERSHRAMVDRHSFVQGIKCKNYELCGESFPDGWWERKLNYLCAPCNLDWGRELHFKEPEECLLCYETKVHVQFPGQCDHWFCCNCTSVIVYGKEMTPGVSPQLFGCPPCPNNCVNPVIGVQCSCEEYENVKNLWTHENRDKAAEYRLFVEEKTTYLEATDRCPLCRSQAFYKKWKW